MLPQEYVVKEWNVPASLVCQEFPLGSHQKSSGSCGRPRGMASGGCFTPWLQLQGALPLPISLAGLMVNQQLCNSLIGLLFTFTVYPVLTGHSKMGCFYAASAFPCTAWTQPGCRHQPSSTGIHCSPCFEVMQTLVSIFTGYVLYGTKITFIVVADIVNVMINKGPYWPYSSENKNVYKHDLYRRNRYMS